MNYWNLDDDNYVDDPTETYPELDHTLFEIELPASHGICGETVLDFYDVFRPIGLRRAWAVIEATHYCIRCGHEYESHGIAGWFCGNCCNFSDLVTDFAGSLNPLRIFARWIFGKTRRYWWRGPNRNPAISFVIYWFMRLLDMIFKRGDY